jgi:hypothetical protein
MNLIKFKSKDALQLFHTFLVNQKQGTVFCVHDEKMVLVPKAKVVNETMCYEMGYKILEEPYSGGVIVSNIGDIWVVDFGEIKNDFAKRFSSYIIDFLKSKGLEASYQDNDILVDGYSWFGIAFGYHLHTHSHQYKSSGQARHHQTLLGTISWRYSYLRGPTYSFNCCS